MTIFLFEKVSHLTAFKQFTKNDSNNSQLMYMAGNGTDGQLLFSIA
jgi:hypothetical protein